MNLVFHRFESLPSTQRYSKEHMQALSKDALTCTFAREQTSGYGRRGSPWVSKAGKGLYTTYCFFHANSVGLAQVVMVALARTLIGLGLTPTLKWPNDLLINGKKLAGCLVEATACGDATALHIGIGANVLHTKEELAFISQPATSIALEGISLTIDELLLLFSETLKDVLMIYIEQGFAPFQEEYATLLHLETGSTFTVRQGDSLQSALYEGVTKEGRLLATFPDGTIRELT